MVAFITYLYLTGKSRHCFVLAPNKTIYEKLIADFSPESPKYVFKGIAEFAANPPLIVTGENYESGLGVRFQGGNPTTHSIVMRSKSGTIREIKSEHALGKLRRYASVDFDAH